MAILIVPIIFDWAFGECFGWTPVHQSSLVESIGIGLSVSNSPMSSYKAYELNEF